MRAPTAESSRGSLFLPARDSKSGTPDSSGLRNLTGPWFTRIRDCPPRYRRYPPIDPFGNLPNEFQGRYHLTAFLTAKLALKFLPRLDPRPHPPRTVRR